MKIIWSPLSIDRTSEITDYISPDNPSAAKMWVETIFNKIDILESSPKAGIIVPEIES